MGAVLSRLSQSLRPVLLVAAGLLTGVALMIYDELLTAARYGYCYPYPLLGCVGDVYVASAVPFTMIIVAAILLGLRIER